MLKMKVDNPGKNKILCFGELLLRICPDVGGEWLINNNLPCYVGGAELNVATALALWGIPSSYLSVLPDNLLGTQLAGYVASKGINTDSIVFGGNRVGTYYLPKGRDVKSSGVIYDRAYSAFAGLKPGDIDWDSVFSEVSWFHFSAICPALTESLAAVCHQALKYASSKEIFISLDLNYRASLWQYGKQPSDVIPALARYCNLIMGNIWSSEKMLGITLPNELVPQSKKVSI